MENTSITPSIQTYAVDFARSGNNILFLKGMQGDGYGTRYADISLMNNGKSYHISADSVRAVIRGTKPDNKSIFNECEIIEDSTIRIEITQQMAAVPGRGSYEISIISLEENRVLTSFPFFIMISKSVFRPEETISSNEFGLLIDKINRADELTADITEQLRESAGALNEMNTLHDSVQEAESQRAAAEEARQTAVADAVGSAEAAALEAAARTAAMQELEQNINAAENARTEAENLRQQNTSAAIQNAEKAAQEATEAAENLQNILDAVTEEEIDALF